MLGANSFSLVCRAFVDRVGELLDADHNDITLVIGPPALAEKSPPDNSSQLINFFFYRFSAWEFDSDVAPDEVFRLRASCMITPIGKDANNVSASEHELRMLGGVLRALHGEQSMPLGEFGTGEVKEQVQLQIALQKPEVEELNHVWSAQPEATFRSSLVYEVALVPVIPEAAPSVPPLVGTTGVRVRPKVDEETGRPDRSWAQLDKFDGTHDDPEVEAVTVELFDEAWAPVLCFVKGGVCSRVVHSTAAGFDGQLVWVAGKKDAAVTLRWRTWTRARGWADEAATVDAKGIGETLDPNAAPDETFRDPSDPDYDPNVDTKYSKGGLRKVSLPGSVAGGGHAVLVAERGFTRASEVRSDGQPGPTHTVESEPVLVVVAP